MATSTPTKPRDHTARRHHCSPVTAKVALLALVVASVFVAGVNADKEDSPSVAADGKTLVLTGVTIAFVLNDGSHATLNSDTFLDKVGCLMGALNASCWVIISCQRFAECKKRKKNWRPAWHFGRQHAPVAMGRQK